MIKTASLSKDGKKKISEHFCVYETASTSNTPYNPSKIWSDTCKYDTELVDMLEKLYSAVDAKEIRISSWYRTPEHDKNVGGNGSGQHTKGCAVDCAVIDKNNKIIDTKVISCIAQDLGFKGIARINNNYIHLDMGNRVRRYLGDETKSTNTVTTDFYNYYGLTKEYVNGFIKNYNTTPSINSDSIQIINYQVYTNKWLPIVSNSTIVNDYAGIERTPIRAIRITSCIGHVKYRVHIKEVNSWTSWVDSQYDKGDLKTYSGAIEQGFTVDAIQIELLDTNYDIYYRVSTTSTSGYYPYVKNDSDYAGKFGLPIDKVQIYVKEK